MASSYALSAWFFTRAIAAVYCIAFVSLAVQTRGLFSTRGVLPIAEYLTAVEAQTDAARYLQMPSLFWLDSTDSVLVGAAWAGAACAVLAFFGVAQGWMFLACFILYLSFVGAGQDFMSFQWDSLLLETGFLTLFIVPWTFSSQLWNAVDPHWSVRALFYLLLFKLMFLSGVVKILSGDPAWRDFSALSYHYWTQPLPNPLSPFVHFLPAWFHRASTALTFFIELACPFLIAWPRARVGVAGVFVLLSMMIGLTGNYTFFNILTVTLCFWLIPDRIWEQIASFFALPIVDNPIAMFAHPAPSVVMIFLAAMSLFWCTRFWLPDNVTAAVWPVVRAVQSFHLSNPYGLFATMTKTRPEIVIEGSQDGNNWEEYEFRYKPGNLHRPLPIVAPHQPRLDWQMWFAALGTFRENYFVQNLMHRLLEAEPEVLAFFLVDPFAGDPPRYVRARLYNYEFTSDGEIMHDGLWWRREYLGEYAPVMTKSE